MAIRISSGCGPCKQIGTGTSLVSFVDLDLVGSDFGQIQISGSGKIQFGFGQFSFQMNLKYNYSDKLIQFTISQQNAKFKKI
jgi:hypothetical protein